LEQLEAREVPAAVAHPNYVLLPSGSTAHPYNSTGPTGTTPSQIRQAYGFNKITFANGTVTGDGSGTTIAIVDAYDDPNIANDLHQFDVRFGLPDPTFKKVNENGGTSMPAADGGWASEIALDVEWAHAIAPKASILLVEASDASFGNLLTAEQYAASQPGVVVVSNSWGGGEFSGENSYDSSFTTPSGHAGVTFVVASGDSGAPASYPATAPTVLSAGGTTLNLDSSGNILSESAWSGSGGGISAYEAQPSFQKGIVTQTTTRRANPDVSYDADPYTGFPVYDSYNNGTAAPWSQFGGTSDAAPQWAALIAIADQGRAVAGLSSLDGATQTLPMLYSLPATDFHDITTGSSTGSPHESAGPGYDLATGRGTPVANLIVSGLVGTPAPVSGATHFSVSAPSSAVAGSAFTVTVTALNSSGQTYTAYTGTVQLTTTDTAATVALLTNANGVLTFSVTLKTAGSTQITATDSSNSSVTGNTSVTVSAAAADHLVFVQQPGSTTVGATLNPAVTVEVLDLYNNVVTSGGTVVTLTLNPTASALVGTAQATAGSNGLATFSGLSVNAAGTYTLTAGATGVNSATSSSFTISTPGTSPNGTVIEGFETVNTWYVSGFGDATGYLTTYAAHDGTYGLDQSAGNNWFYRKDAGAQLKAGDTASVWLQFAGSADGRAYFGFGAGDNGTLSLVAAPNTGQLIIQSNVNYGFTNLAAVGQHYLANHWYRLEVDWGTSGKIVGKLFDSNGTTLLNTVTATTKVITAGGIAFRATGSDKYWDTVTAAYGVNTFTTTTGTRTFVAAPAEQSTASTPAWLQALWAWEAEHGPFTSSSLYELWSSLPESTRAALDRFFAGW
jgi:hypothetical protein